MPPYYSYYLYSTSIEDSRCWLRTGTANTLTYGYSKNTRPMREACEASTNSVLLPPVLFSLRLSSIPETKETKVEQKLDNLAPE